MAIKIRDWTEFSDEVEKFRRSYDGNHKVLFKSIKSKEDIFSKDYPVQHWIEVADDIQRHGGRLILEDIKNIKSSLFEFGVSITKAIDEYKELDMTKEEVDELIYKFRKYAEEAELRLQRFYCQ